MSKQIVYMNPLSILEMLDQPVRRRFSTNFVETKVNAQETDDGYIIEVLVPGVPVDNIQITSKDNALSLSAIASEDKSDIASTNYHIKEFTAKYSRTIAFPKDADLEHAEASLKDGILRIEIPKLEKAQPKSIPISLAG